MKKLEQCLKIASSMAQSVQIELAPLHQGGFEASAVNYGSEGDGIGDTIASCNGDSIEESVDALYDELYKMGAKIRDEITHALEIDEKTPS